jgi:hypothetical protein
MQGKAAGGKAQGESRSVLCQAVVDCVRRERCAQILPFDFQPVGNLSNQFLRCFCDRDVTEGSYVTRCSTPPSSPPKPDEAVFVPGKCSEEFLEASEVDNLSEAFKGQLTAKTKPFGGANLLLLECDRILCTEECMPEASSGTVAQIAADILTTPNDAGETPFGDLVADSERSAMSTDFAFFDQAAMQPEYVPDPWGLFFKVTPGRPADGDGRILESEVLQALFGIEIRNSSINPSVGTKLVTMQLTGAQVYGLLNSLLGTVDVSGLAYTWDATLPSGSRVTEVRKGGVALDQAATFSLAVSNVLAKSIVGGTNVVTSDKRPAEELITYLKAQPQAISPPPSDRVIRLD